MKLSQVESRNGLIVLSVEDDRGPHEISLTTMDVALLIGALRSNLEETIGHPSAESMALPGMVRVQYVETDKENVLRIYMNDHVSHDYPVPKGTDLADELKRFADRFEAKYLAMAKYQSPDSGGNKPN